jgi:protein TonB
MMQNNNKYKILIDRTLPWDDLPGDRLRKHAILLLLLLFCIVSIIIIESTVVPKKDRAEEEIPERLAQLVMERKKKEEPPPPPEPEEEEPEEEEPEEEPEEEEPEPEPEPEKEIDKAREKAKKELSVFDEQLAGLQDLAPTPRNADNLRRSGSESAKIERDLITSRAGTGSGGVQTAKASSGGGGGGTLESGQVAQVESNISEEAATETRTTKEGKSQRTRQQVRRVFDQYGGRLYSIYARALRKNPALQGTVTFALEIAPSGEVTSVSIKSSELGDPALEQKLLTMVKLFDFGALPVEPWRNDYTVNFFPQ